MKINKMRTKSTNKGLSCCGIKKTIKLILLTIFVHSVQAQDTGIKFEHNSNWQSIVAMAKAKDKYIFVDCFTTWCGPCREMSNNIFPMEEVGNFFNAKF